MSIAFLLLSVLKDHGDAEDQNGVDANNAKGRSKNKIQIAVGEGGELANASALLRSNKRVQAGAVLDERW
jgi:hypothetical protein